MRTLCFLVAACALFAVAVVADVPHQISYQGLLTDDTGAGINGPTDISFSIFADSSTSTLLWKENHVDVPVVDGLFNIMLGSITALSPSIFDGSAHYMQLVVEGEALADLTPIASVAHAYRSLMSDTAQYARNAGGAPDSLWQREGDHYVGLNYSTDSVGLGTLFPAAKLHVEGDILLDDGGDLRFGFGDNRIYTFFEDLMILSDHDVRLLSPGNIRLGSGVATDWGYVNPTERLFGLGIASPTEMLHLSTTTAGERAFMKIESMHASDWGEVGMRFETPQNRWHFRMDDNSNNNLPDGALGLRSQQGAIESMTWAEDGNVGIAKTNPAERLDVNGNAIISGTLTAGQIVGDFPNGSINTTDISNEAGLTYTSYYSHEDDITGLWASYWSHTITTPTNSGFILALASAQIEINHGVTDYSYVYLSITPYASPGPTSQNAAFKLGDDVNEGTYTTEISIHRVFPVTAAGTHTFHLNANSGEDNATIGNRHMTLIYIPTAYVVKDGSTTDGSTDDPSAATLVPSDETSVADLTMEIAELKRRLSELESR
ncbi:hypothetical protein KQH51_03350 [bacterium]|nr:hypothetical protein [bacterium]MCB2201958.1 hypothetical protein [bacterium]